MTSVASQTRLARWWDGDLAYGFRRSPVAIVSALVLAMLGALAFARAPVRGCARCSLALAAWTATALGAARGRL